MSVLNETMINVISNFVPKEKITCNDRNPPRMNQYIKNVIITKNKFYKRFVLTTNKMYHHFSFKNLQNQLNQSIQTAK